MLFIFLTVFLESLALFFLIVAPSRMVTCSCFPSPSSLSSSQDASHWPFLLVTLFFPPICCYPQVTLLVYLVATFLLDFPQKWDLSVAYHLGPQARLAATLPLCTFYQLFCGGLLLDHCSPLSAPTVLSTLATQAADAQNREHTSLRLFWPQNYCILQ